MTVSEPGTSEAAASGSREGGDRGRVDRFPGVASVLPEGLGRSKRLRALPGELYDVIRTDAELTRHERGQQRFGASCVNTSPLIRRSSPTAACR